MHSGLGCAVACSIKQVCSFQNVAVTNDAAIHDLVQMYLHVVGSLSSRWTSGCGVAGRKAGAQAVTNKYQWHPPPQVDKDAYFSAASPRGYIVMFSNFCQPGR